MPANKLTPSSSDLPSALAPLWRVTPRTLLRGLFVVAAALAAAAAPAPALANPGIDDAAGVFSPAAIEAAKPRLAALNQRGVEVQIETLATLPGGDSERVASLPAAEKSAYFKRLAQQRGDAKQASGVFILVCRQPGRVEVEIKQSLYQRGLPKDAWSTVSKAMLAEFGKKRFDEGLAAGLTALDAASNGLRSNEARPANGLERANPNLIPGERQPQAPAPAPALGGGDMTSLIWIGAAILGGLFLLSLLRRAFSGGAGPGAMGPGGMSPGYGGGGGFGSGLFGGLFGALAGNWLYDSFSNSSAHAGEDHDRHNSGADGGGGGFWGGGGGDWGGGGGGDWGGGGGGDFGGGDSGGGGGDF